MIQRDPGNHADVRIDRVDRVQPPAQPNLQHPCLAARPAEQAESRQSNELELGEPYVAAGGLHPVEFRAQVLLAGMISIDLNAFAELLQER